MARFFSVVKRYLWDDPEGQKESVLDNSRQIATEEINLYSGNNSNNSSVNDHKRSSISDELRDLEIERPICLIRTGMVTELKRESGIIDGNIHFDLEQAPSDIRVGEKVTYEAYRSTNDHVWIVVKFLEVEQIKKKDESGKHVVPEEKIVLENKEVTSRNGREVIVNGGEFIFNLDEISSEFTPVKGDLLCLTISPKTSADGQENLVVEAIAWMEYHLVVGTIMSWDAHNKEGMINDSIYFSQDSCTSGYNPYLHDEITCDVIKSNQGQHSLRSLSVTPVQADQKNVKNRINCPSKEIGYLCKNKNGIVVTKQNCNFDKIVKGTYGKEAIVRLTNQGTTNQWILCGDFHLAHSGCQVFPTREVTKFCIRPGDTLSYTFGCHGKFIGLSKEVYVFCFRGFKIGVMFEMEVCVPGLQEMVGEGSTGDRKCEFYQGLKMTRTDLDKVIGGDRPIQPPKFIAERLPLYLIPDRFWSAVLDEKRILKHIPVIQRTIESIIPCLADDLTHGNYKTHFHSLLYLEEIDGTLKLQKYSMSGVEMTPELGRGANIAREFMRLEVPGLAEKRPALLVGDKVLAVRSGADSSVAATFEGFVHEVFGASILLKFARTFHEHYLPGEKFDIRFEFGRTAIRRQHAALDMSCDYLGEQILFPTQLFLQPPQLPEEFKIRWLNETLNDNQKEVIRNVLRGEARPLPYLIFGPPGTGKTVTLVELILQILTCIPKSHLLISTPSNSSANLLAERLIDSGLATPEILVRLVGYHVFQDHNLSKKLHPFATTGNIMVVRGDEGNASKTKGQLQQSSNRTTLSTHRIVVGTCVALGQLVTMGIPQGHFTHVIVDECGQATEPEILVPLGLVSKKGQLILAGDPLQLGAVVGSNLAAQYGLGESLLDRLLNRFPYERDMAGFPDTQGHDPRLISRLVNNYRSLPEILALPNTLFYESSLRAMISPTNSPEAKLLATMYSWLPKRDARFGGPPAVVFHGVVGRNLQEPDSPSWFNVEEIDCVKDYVIRCYQSGIAVDDVGIITPYRQQIKKLKHYLNTHNVPAPKIGSVEEFQGQERKVIIVSAVRSISERVSTDVIHSMGFVSSKKRINVTLTRAQCLLIVVGNPHLLLQDNNWKYAVEYCIDRQSYVGCDPPDACKPAINTNVYLGATWQQGYKTQDTPVGYHRPGFVSRTFRPDEVVLSEQQGPRITWPVVDMMSGSKPNGSRFRLQHLRELNIDSVEASQAQDHKAIMVPMESVSTSNNLPSEHISIPNGPRYRLKHLLELNISSTEASQGQEHRSIMVPTEGVSTPNNLSSERISTPNERISTPNDPRFRLQHLRKLNISPTEESQGQEHKPIVVPTEGISTPSNDPLEHISPMARRFSLQHLRELNVSSVDVSQVQEHRSSIVLTEGISNPNTVPSERILTPNGPRLRLKHLRALNISLTEASQGQEHRSIIVPTEGVSTPSNDPLEHISPMARRFSLQHLRELNVSSVDVSQVQEHRSSIVLTDGVSNPNTVPSERISTPNGPRFLLKHLQELNVSSMDVSQAKECKSIIAPSEGVSKLMSVPSESVSKSNGSRLRLRHLIEQNLALGKASEGQEHKSIVPFGDVSTPIIVPLEDISTPHGHQFSHPRKLNMGSLEVSQAQEHKSIIVMSEDVSTSSSVPPEGVSKPNGPRLRRLRRLLEQNLGSVTESQALGDSVKA